MTKALLIFAAQASILGMFLTRLWAWRSTEKGRSVLTEVGAMVAYWLLVCLLLLMIAASAWFQLGPIAGYGR